jgi:ribosomal protein S18 acetylase RimI-like enzyme
MEIKTASIADAEVLAELGKKTFIDTFAKDNRPEDMALYVSQTFGTDKQLAEILDTKRLISIAWVGSIAAGYYHLLDGAPDPSVSGENPIEVLRLYVDSNWHSKGIGPALMSDCIKVAGNKGYKTIWLGVWEKNLKAQAFYQKYSFEQVGTHIFTLGTDDQVDIIMSRNI